MNMKRNVRDRRFSPRVDGLEMRTMLSGVPPMGVNMDFNSSSSSSSRAWVDVKNLFNGPSH